jgi:prepilin-type N-terminal cleavage/methylation domain-containing protein
MYILKLLRHRLQWKLPYPSGRLTGFTLIELLIVVAIASIIVSTLLSLVVELTATEQRESSRTETQREMQMALDYVASDVKEAVFVYQNMTDLVKGLPSEIGFDATDPYRPVLAFWKTKAIPEEDLQKLKVKTCTASGFTSDQTKECNNILDRRRTYSLVAYALSTDSSTIWKGKARLVRYELGKYKNNDFLTLTRNKGFVDPAELGSTSFESWPFDKPKTDASRVNCQNETSTICPVKSDSATLSSSPPSTLVDFLDAPSNPASTDPAFSQKREDARLGCSEDGKTVDGVDLVRVPPDGTGMNRPSFFACIRKQPGSETFGYAQDVELNIRGNASGRPGVKSDSFLPTLQTRISMRGVIDKQVK